MPDATIASLAPALIAIGLAIVLRQVLLPLAAGVFAGAAILAWTDGQRSQGDWTRIAADAGWRFVAALHDSVIDQSHLLVLGFTMLLGAMVGVMEVAGGIDSLLRRLSLRIRSRRGAQTLIGLSGLAIFFDDYANTLLIGGAMRPTADRSGVSRAKLAYLVDSTAAPVAGLAIVSTWAATEISYLETGLQQAAAAGVVSSIDAATAFELFVASIPYRFYPLLALVMVFAVAISGRDFGPMRLAEAETGAAAKTADADADAHAGPDGGDAPTQGWLAALSTAVLPMVVCVSSLAATLWVTGSNAVNDPAWAASQPWTLRRIGQVFGQGDSYWALMVGGAAGLAVATTTSRWPAGRSWREILRGGLRGGIQMLPAMFVLWLAWALSAMTDPQHLNTGGYLASWLSDRLSATWLPTCVFVLSGAVAFATGTSWGTMSLLTPIAVSLALQLDPLGGVGGVISLATFGSVLAGSIFGDHCSPISDTTVLSSRAARCDHLQHVQTQMPYALVVGAISIAAGTVPVAWGVPVTVCLGLGVAAVIGVVWIWGRLPRSV